MIYSKQLGIAFVGCWLSTASNLLKSLNRSTLIQMKLFYCSFHDQLFSRFSKAFEPDSNQNDTEAEQK